MILAFASSAVACMALAFFVRSQAAPPLGADELATERGGFLVAAQEQIGHVSKS